MACIEGNGTQKTAAKFTALGANNITIPKTIDNDVLGADYTSDFDTIVSITLEAVD